MRALQFGQHSATIPGRKANMGKFKLSVGFVVGFDVN